MDDNDNTQLQQGDNLHSLSQEFICAYIDEAIAATRNGTMDWKSGFVMDGCEYRNCLFRGRLLLYRGIEPSRPILYITFALTEEETQHYVEHRYSSINISGVTVSGDYAVRAIQRIEEAHHICATRRDRRERIKRILTDDTFKLVLFIVVVIGLIYAAVSVGLSLRA